MEADPEALRRLLKADYGLDAGAIAPAPRGFVAVTYVVDVGGGRRVFVKWLPAWASAEEMAAGLRAAAQLQAAGIEEVSRPLATLDGRLSTQLEGLTLVVFEHVAGTRGAVRDQRLGPASFNYDFEASVALLARIHAATPRLAGPFSREDFALPWASAFAARWAAALADPAERGPRAKLRRLMQARDAELRADWARLRALRRACRSAAWTPVLTHGDAAGDNLILGENGRLYLIDWDAAVLAPVERDAWFFLNDPDAARAFTAAYRRVFPGWRPSQRMRRFYLFYRFFQDLDGYLMIVQDTDDETRQAWSLSELEKTCYDWLCPAMHPDAPPLGRIYAAGGA